MTIVDYIDANYVVVWRHPDSTVKDWKRFLLEELHENEEVRKVNGLFISLFASENSILLIEGEERLRRCRFPQSIIREFYIESPHIVSDRIFGWDMKDFALHNAHKTVACDVAVHILRTNEKIEELDFKKEMVGLWKQKLIETGDSELLAAEDWIRQLEEALASAAEEMQEFVRNEIEPLTFKIDAYSQKMNAFPSIVKQILDEAALCNDPLQLLEYLKKMTQCQSDCLNIQNEKKACLARKESLIVTKIVELT